MDKQPKGKPHKRPPAPTLKMRKLIGPMSLGDMRLLGPRSLIVTCTACGYHTLQIVSKRMGCGFRSLSATFRFRKPE